VSGSCHRSYLVPAGLGHDAIVDLYRRLRPRLANFFLRRTRDPEAAIDLVAETFARAVEHARRFRGGADADPWVWGIARNVLAEHVRRDHREQRTLRRLALEPSVTTTETAMPGPDAAGGAATHALQELVADQRDALRLRVVEELDYAVVARRLGVTEPAARARVSRGLRKLADSLDHTKPGKPNISTSAGSAWNPTTRETPVAVAASTTMPLARNLPSASRE
jgi:RNA polymerase sigma factor (sigma-70 family)